MVRYIHLKPLGVWLVNDVPELGHWPWSGHTALVDKKGYEFQDEQYVLSQFGSTMAEARSRYRDFVVAGIAEGRRPDLGGGGLIRSLDDRAASLGLIGRGRERWAYDERVPASSDFVSEVLEEARERQFSGLSTPEQIKAALDHIIARVGIRLG